MKNKLRMIVFILVTLFICSACSKEEKPVDSEENATVTQSPPLALMQNEAISPTAKPNKSELDIEAIDEINSSIGETKPTISITPAVTEEIEEIEENEEIVDIELSPTPIMDTQLNHTEESRIFDNNSKAYIDDLGTVAGIRVFDDKITITDIIEIKSDTLVIPSTIDRKPVVAIGNGALELVEVSKVVISNGITRIEAQAFYGNTNIKQISIPESVADIGMNALGNCSKLEKIELSSKNANYCLVNGVLYNKEKTSIIRYPAARKDETCFIEEGVVSIEAGAFSMSKNLAYVFFPKSLRSIGIEAFAGCILLDVDIPEKLIELEAFAFANCYSMRKIVIPKGIEEIAEGTFSGCEKATSITFLGTVKEIGYSAFSNCSLVNKVEFKSSASFIGEMAFAFCTSLKSITLPSGTQEIADMAFYSCYNLEQIMIPDTVSFFGSMIFDQISNVVIKTPKESKAVEYAQLNGIACIKQ